MSNPLISCRNLCRFFADGEQKITAVDHVNIEIFTGEFAVLYGPSGSGKTTLLNLIGGLDHPTSGDVYFDKAPYSTLSETQLTQLRLQNIGFIFQSYNLIPVFSVLENVAFIMQMQGVPRETYLTESKKILELVGLQKLQNRRPSEMSGGQQQRVAIARAIAAKPKIVLADEPTANLDSSNSMQLIDLMRELNKQLEMTFVISSHDDKVIASAKRKIQLNDGKVISDESF